MVTATTVKGECHVASCHAVLHLSAVAKMTCHMHQDGNNTRAPCLKFESLPPLIRGCQIALLCSPREAVGPTLDHIMWCLPCGI